MITSQSAPADMAHHAVKHLLQGMAMPIMLIGDVRPTNFPLPMKRIKPAQVGADTVQEYRPLAVLEYVHEVVTGVVAAAEARERAKAKKDEEQGS